MIANKFSRPLPIRPGIWLTLFFPLVAAAVLMAVDVYLIPGIFALPLLFMGLLFFLSLRLPPRIVLLWALIFTGTIYVFGSLRVADSVTDPKYRPYVRTAVFLTAGTGAVLLAAFRQRLQAGHETLFRIISDLPLVVIVSDIEGRILLLNDQAREVLKSHLEAKAGLSYFTLFAAPGDAAKAAARYAGYFGSSHVGTASTVLRTRGDSPLSLHATVTSVTVDGNRYAITMVERIEHVAEESLPLTR
jgi:PAS domain-containing protein